MGLGIRVSLGRHLRLLKEDKTQKITEGQIHLSQIISNNNNRKHPMGTVQDIKYHELFLTVIW